MRKTRIAIVTGASSGLGAEFVRRLDRESQLVHCGAYCGAENACGMSGCGALDEIWVIARREERLKRLQNEVKTPLRTLALDLTDRASLDTLRALLRAQQPDIRLLVIAAGFGKIGSWEDISDRDAAGMIDLNCRAAVLVTQMVLPFMGRGSRVAEICSTAAFQPFPYMNVYAATKAFLLRYSRALGFELRPRGISVTAVCPYWVKDTEFIPTAQTGSSYVHSFPLASREKNVVRRALADIGKRRAVSTPGLVCTAHRLVAGFPDALKMVFWDGMRRL